MKKTKVYQISMLIAISAITIGCSGSKVTNAKIEKASTTAPVVNATTPTESEITLANLKSSGVSTVSLKGNPTYKKGTQIRFIVNTMDKSGYLYIIYLDNKGNTGLLYPNEHSPLTELSGEYLFPRDFGNMNIIATKDCQNCQQEKTTVYALLSQKPIADINNITKEQLMNFTTRGASQSKGLVMSSSGPRVDNSNLNVGKLEFYVK